MRAVRWRSDIPFGWVVVIGGFVMMEVLAFDDYFLDKCYDCPGDLRTKMAIAVSNVSAAFFQMSCL